MTTTHFSVISTPRSKAYSCLAILLEEVDLIIAALPKKVRGRPKKDERNNINNKRDALCKAALVLLSAALEAYCERLCGECNTYLKEKLGGLLDKSDYDFIERSIKGSHGADTKHITGLFSLVGIPWITYESIGWQKNSPAGIRKELRAMASVRNRIAHGAKSTVSEGRVLYWRNFVFRFADKLEEITGNHLAKRTNTNRPWQ